MNNPFTLDFGKEPTLYIPRNAESRKIIETFCSDIPSTHIFIIVGARGAGKTVLMTTVSRKLCEDDRWIHIDLNPETDLLNGLASNLNSKSKKRFPKIGFDLSVKGLGVSLESDRRYSDIQVDLDEMIKTIGKKDVRILVTVDEISNSKNIREFTSYFQHCLREELPVFVLATGLYKNVRALQNSRSQTFLRRAPKINLEALNTLRIAKSYEKVFGISHLESVNLSKMTCGYSYAFQILGYMLFESGEKVLDDDTLFEYKMSLYEGSYEKIWEEMSESERLVIKAIAEMGDNVRVKEVREKISMNSNNYSTYQNTLIKSGILSGETAYGSIEFALPFFREFVVEKML